MWKPMLTAFCCYHTEFNLRTHVCIIQKFCQLLWLQWQWLMDERCVQRICGMKMRGENQSTQRKTSSNDTSSTINTKWVSQGLKLNAHILVLHDSYLMQHFKLLPLKNRLFSQVRQNVTAELYKTFTTFKKARKCFPSLTDSCDSWQAFWSAICRQCIQF